MARPDQFSSTDVTVIIPTIGREEVLLDTIRACLSEPQPPFEVIVVDQSQTHEPATIRQLSEWAGQGSVRVLTPNIASQPAAMNVGLQSARSRLLLFLDDDVQPTQGFVAAHAELHQDQSVWVAVGQIIQPWQQPEDLPRQGPTTGLRADLEFPFHSTRECLIQNGMSGHMSVRRDHCLAVGGFDENFKGAAYRFDTEFARRVIQHGGKVLYSPKASLKHLRVARGGTRLIGNHLASADPIHGVGDYYFALQLATGWERWSYIGTRMFREVRTKFHLRHPWYIPVKLLGEVRALFWAYSLSAIGAKLIRQSQSVSDEFL
jgi:GT2 family glycosyltransferase